VKQLLRDGANMLNIVVEPAVNVALRHKVNYKYPIPTMAVSVLSPIWCNLWGSMLGFRGHWLKKKHKDMQPLHRLDVFVPAYHTAIVLKCQHLNLLLFKLYQLGNRQDPLPTVKTRYTLLGFSSFSIMN
jgi:hypothetical protein